MATEEPMVVPSILMDLSTLLAESMQQKAEKDELKEAQKRVSTGRGTKEELSADSDRLRKWAQEKEWKRKANVLVFTRQRCSGCGTFHQTLLGKFEQFEHARKLATTMLTAVKGFEIPTLPKEVVYQDAETSTCHNCADFDGWPLEEE